MKHSSASLFLAAGALCVFTDACKPETSRRDDDAETAGRGAAAGRKGAAGSGGLSNQAGRGGAGGSAASPSGGAGTESGGSAGEPHLTAGEPGSAASGGSDNSGGAPDGSGGAPDNSGGAPDGNGGAFEAGAAGAPEAGAGGASTSESAALQFDGVDDQVLFAVAAGAGNEAAFSVEVWFKTAALTGMLFEVYSDSPLGADRSLYLEDGKLCFYVYAPALSALCTTGSLNDDTWHHVAGTLGAAGQVLYVDGASQGEVPAVTASAFNWDSGFRAGYGHIGPNGALVYYAGLLDELRVWNIQRSGPDITANMHQSLNPAATGLQGYWKLDEVGTATAAADSTAAGMNGALNGFSFTPSPWVSSSGGF